MDIRYGAKSDVGLKRDVNEDRFCTAPDLGLYVICDGMGGHNAGEVASGLAIEVIKKHVQEVVQDPGRPLLGYDDPAFSPQTNRLASAIRLANHVVNAEAQARPSLAGMGTTVVSAVLGEQTLSVAHVGDSRLYLIRGESIQLLTADHSLVAEQIREGLLSEAEAERSPRKNILTRALGVEATVDVELGEVPVMSGDVVLLCSDGLTRHVSPADIMSAVREARHPQEVSERLVEMANATGGEDNTTVILVTVSNGSTPGLLSRIVNRIVSRILP